jgi:hypothetical protein
MIPMARSVGGGGGDRRRLRGCLRRRLLQQLLEGVHGVSITVAEEVLEDYKEMRCPIRAMGKMLQEMYIK